MTHRRAARHLLPALLAVGGCPDRRRAPVSGRHPDPDDVVRSNQRFHRHGDDADHLVTGDLRLGGRHLCAQRGLAQLRLPAFGGHPHDPRHDPDEVADVPCRDLHLLGLRPGERGVERHRRPADVRRRRRVVGATHNALGDDADRKPGGTALPVGDLPGWKQAFVDDFVTPVPAGSFPGPYAVKWTSYHGFRDTFGIAYYDRSAISVQSGMMDLFLHTRSGTPIGAAPVPIVTKVWQRQAFGRFSVRFRSDPLPGYKAAWLLWPESDNWNEGEIDFPEGGLDSTMWGFITA